MSEIEAHAEDTPIENAKKRLEIAIEAAFGGVLSHPDDPMESVFVPFVDFEVGEDKIKNQLADLAIKELLQSAAEIEKEQTREKMKGMNLYSDEYIALEKTGPFEIAYDYILGNRVTDKAASIAAGILSEIIITADKRNWDFRKMKEGTFKWKEPTRVEWHEHNFLVEGQRKQIKKLQEFIFKKYNIRPATIYDADMVKEVVKSRIRPIIQPEFSITS